MSLFAIAIKEARGKVSYRMFALRVDVSPKIVKDWENGVLPGTRTFNRIVKELNWDEYKASMLADDIEHLKERQREYRAKKIQAYDRIRNLVTEQSGSSSDIEKIVKETEKYA